MFLFINANNIVPSVLSNLTKQRNNTRVFKSIDANASSNVSSIFFQKFQVCVGVGLRERPPFTISQPISLYSKSQTNKGLEIISGKEVNYYIKIKISSKTRNMKEHNQLFKIYKICFLGALLVCQS